MRNSNKILIVVFLAVLLLPFALALCFPNIAHASAENRTLASFPSIEETGFSNWTAEFDTYLNDHLPFKAVITKLYSNSLHRFFRESSSLHVIEGKDGWLLYKGYDNDDPIADLMGISSFSEEDMEDILHRLESFDSNHPGVPFVLFLAPNKETTLRDMFPDSYAKYFADETRSEQLREYLHDKTNAFCFPGSELQTKKLSFPYPLYFKYDTHWNQIGAYYGLTLVCDRLGVTLPRLEDVKITQQNELLRKDLAALIKTESMCTDDFEYRVSPYENVTCSAGEKQFLFEHSSAYLQVFTSDAPNDRTLILSGDSFSEVMLDVARSCFQKIIFIRRDTGHLEELHALIEAQIEENPGCLVSMEVVERGAGWLTACDYVF